MCVLLQTAGASGGSISKLAALFLFAWEFIFNSIHLNKTIVFF